MQMSLYDGDWAERGVPQLLVDLKRHPPALILASSPMRCPGSAPSLSATRNQWASSSPEVVSAWAEFYDYVQQNYTKERRLGFAP